MTSYSPPRVAVVGGGPAGLQAALTLGRMHRDVVLLDSGEYRNAPAHAMQNFLTRDGTPPTEFRAAARADLARYDTVTVHETRVDTIDPDGEGFTLTTSDGERLTVDAVVLATGVRDELPSTPGVAELWGTVVAHCPYCHGHEHAGQDVAVLGASPHAAALVGLLGPIAAGVTVLADGQPMADATREAVLALGGSVRDERVVEVVPDGDGARVVLQDGGTLAVGGLFVGTGLTASAPFAEHLGLDLLPSGGIRVDERGRTSRPGVYAAGDAAHVEALPMPMASVLIAAAAGMLAATSVDGDRLMPIVAG